MSLKWSQFALIIWYSNSPPVLGGTYTVPGYSVSYNDKWSKSNWEKLDKLLNIPLKCSYSRLPVLRCGPCKRRSCSAKRLWCSRLSWLTWCCLAAPTILDLARLWWGHLPSRCLMPSRTSTDCPVQQNQGLPYFLKEHHPHVALTADYYCSFITSFI